MTAYGGAMGLPFSDLKRGAQQAVGLAGKAIDRSIEPVERGVAYAADYWSDKGLEPVAAAFRGAAPAVLGLRAANANFTSGGGTNFTPLPRDERHFSTKALENISDNLAAHGGTRTERFAPLRGDMSDMSWWESSQGLGGSRVKDGHVTDVFDINKNEPGEKVLSALFGSSSAPDAGKIATRIPVDLLPESKRLRQDSKGGNAIHAAEKSQDYTAHEESTAPTDEQLQEAIEFLETVMEIGAPQNQWEQQAVKRIHDVLVATLENGQRVNSGEQPEPPQDENGTVVGAVGGGTADDDRPEDLFQDDPNDSTDNGSLDDLFQTAESTDTTPTETEKLAEQVHNQLKEMADNGEEISGDTSTQVANQIKSGDQSNTPSDSDSQTNTIEAQTGAVQMDPRAFLFVPQGQQQDSQQWWGQPSDTDGTTAPGTVPGLASIQGRRGGSASYTYNGRHISRREAEKLMNKSRKM